MKLLINTRWDSAHLFLLPFAFFFLPRFLDDEFGEDLDSFFIGALMKTKCGDQGHMTKGMYHKFSCSYLYTQYQPNIHESIYIKI